MKYILALTLVLSGCAGLSPVLDRLAKCAPSPWFLTELAARVLLGSGDWRDELEMLGKQYGPDLVKCAVAELADEWTDVSPGEIRQGVVHGRYTMLDYDRGTDRALRFLRDDTGQN
jgi:hypothetical protein